MNSDTDSAGAAKPARRPASSTFIVFTLMMAIFAFAAAIAAFDRHIGVFLRTTHWEVSHLTLLLGTLALASGIAAVAIRPLGRGHAMLAWPLGWAIWLLVVAAALLFVFRYPVEFYVRYNKNTVEDHVDAVLEEQSLVFNNESSGKALTGTRTTYALTWVGPTASCTIFTLAQPGQCRLMECVVQKTWWLAGGRFDHTWNVAHLSAPDEIRNVQCREVDPKAVKPGSYDQQGRRSVTG